MRYNKEKTQIVYNDFLTLAGIPLEAHEYRLGNRSALDWIVDQYQIQPINAQALQTTQIVKMINNILLNLLKKSLPSVWKLQKW